VRHIGAGLLVIVAGMASTITAQSRSSIADTNVAAPRLSPNGAPLVVDVLASDGQGVTLSARPDGAVRAETTPLSYAALLGLPPGPLPTVTVHRVSWTPAGGREVESREWGGQPGTGLATLEPLGWLRHQRVGRLVVRPAAIDPEAGTIPRLASITLRVDYPRPVEPGDPFPDSPAFEQVLRHALVNAESARSFRTEMQRAAPDPSLLVPDPSAEHIVLTTDGKGGLCAVTGSDLARAGVDVETVDPDALRMWHLGEELPLLIIPDGARSLDDATILVSVPEVPEAYSGRSSTNVLGLTWGNEAGLRMRRRPALIGGEPEVVEGVETVRTIGEDRVRVDHDPTIGERWFWHRLTAERAAPDSRFLVVPDLELVVPGSTAHLELTLYGLTNPPEPGPDHHLRVVVNNRWRKDFTWEGRGPHTVSEAIPSDLLVEGDNVVEVCATGELEVFADHILVDRLVFRYPTFGASGGVFTFTDSRAEDGLYEYHVHGRRGGAVRVLDVTDPGRPVNLTDVPSVREAHELVRFQAELQAHAARSFVVTADGSIPGPVLVEHRPAGPDPIGTPRHADLLVVVHPSLRPALTPLLEHRRRQGLDVVVLTTDEVYAHFSHGYPSPHAIRTLAETAVRDWPRPAPSFLLLVGDASDDPLGRLGYGARDLVPTFVPDAGGFASDAWFAVVSGDDGIADLAVGRIAVSSADQLGAVVGKIIAHEGRDGDRSWRRRALVVADDDPSGRLADEAQTLVAHLDGLGFEPAALLLDDLQLDPALAANERIARTAAAFAPRVREAIETGNGLVHYLGHGGPRVWGHEHILDARPSSPDVDSLTNAGRLPVVLSFSCFNLRFDTPRYDTIAERLVNAPAGGAVAFWGSSGSSNPVPRWSVAEAVRDAGGDGEPLRLGMAFALATLDRMRAHGVVAGAPPDDNNLIGDPSLVLGIELD
jgi:hypothetical protein